MKKYSEICNEILDGCTSIKLIDDYDIFCENCQCRNAGGCLHSDFFEPEQSVAQADRVISERHGMEIGRTYEGYDFLRALGIKENC